MRPALLRSIAFLCLIAGLALHGADRALGASILQNGPEVVRMTPENGAADVDPGLKEIVITFSEPMRDKSWSVTGGGENFPEITSIYYTKGCTVLNMKVKLKPGWDYQFGLNSQSFNVWRSTCGCLPRRLLMSSFPRTSEELLR